MEKRAQQNQALLGQFRKKISTDDADARRSALAAALQSDNSLLRHTAIGLSLDSDDQILKATAIRAGLTSDDKGLRRAAISAGLASQDSGQRGKALEAALGSEDQVMQHQALTQILSHATAVTGVYEADGQTRPFTVDVAQFDSTTDALKGKMLGWDYCENMSGALSGDSITMVNQYGCAVHLSLVDGNNMKGTLIDSREDRYEAQSTIGD